MRQAIVSRVFKRAVAVVTGVVLLLSAFPIVMTFADEVDTQAELLTAITNNKAITLTKDIALNGSWTTPTTTYTQTFNGQGHVISNLNAPLMNSLTGTVKNVGLMCKDAMNGEAMLAKTSSGTVEGVFAYGSISYNGTGSVGGLIGEMTAGFVTKSFSCISISTSTATYAGGLIGKLSGGTVTSCYSAGDIMSTVLLCHTAGLAYAVDADKNGIPEATASDTYSSVQLRAETPYAKPSGVNGLYDNQLSIVRESAANEGLSTRALMDANTLTEAFAVTSTAYPALVNFYHTIWGPTAQNVVRVSTAAAAFTDVDSSKRMEPTEKFVARADYLTGETYVDKTNVASLTWSIASDVCQVYDTVPFIADKGAFTTGTSADLLRSRLEFSSNAPDVAMTATSGNVKRTWYLTASLSKNPYFTSGNGTSDEVFTIADIDELQYVRYYTRVDAAYYKQTADFSIGEDWPPIMDFRGEYNGGGFLLSDMTVKDDGEKALGLFGNTYAAATIEDLHLRNMSVNVTRDVPVGLLLGESATTTAVTNISLSANTNVVKGGGIVGGLVGKATGTLTMTRSLVSVQITGGTTTGGLVGYIAGANSNVTESGVTGYVTGSQNIGGLIGQTGATTTVQHCYSTAAVISDEAAAADGSYAGGLIGNAASTTIKNSYCAALTDAPNFTGQGIIVGTGGNVNNTVYYDKVYLVGTPSGQNVNATALSTEQLIATNPHTDTTWTVDGVHYPQVTWHTTAASYFKYLSPVATLPIYFQQYWEDTETGDITTGFIADTALYSDLSIPVEQPVAVSSSFNNSPAQQVYTFKNGTDSGWGFEAGSGQRRMMLYCKTRTSDGVSDNNNNAGIRVIAIVRDDLVPLKYSVTGVSGARAYVELYYSKDKTNWQGTDVMTKGGDTAKVLYDMPKGSYVKVKVTTADEYAVSSVNIGGTTYSTATDGFYISNGTFSSSTSVTVTLKTNTPPWGLRRQTH